MSKCNTCGQPVQWVWTEYGKRMPLDPDPDPTGNVIMVEGEDGGDVAHQLHRGEDPTDVERWIPHFATCGRVPSVADGCQCVGSDNDEAAQDDSLDRELPDDPVPVVARDTALLVLAIDRAVQVIDHHLTRVFDQLQGISDRLGDIGDQLGRRP